MRRIGVLLSLGVLGVALALAASPALAAFSSRLFVANLSGYEEVPSVSSTGRGWFAASLRGKVIKYKLAYSDLEGGVQQAHMHFGQRGVNGGVSAFLCSNLAPVPPGVQSCPPPPAVITGTITADEVVGPGEQGIDPGEIDELIDAIKAGVTYINVHTDPFPAGEIRGQVERDGR
jgi:hypothetical protein